MIKIFILKVAQLRVFHFQEFQTDVISMLCSKISWDKSYIFIIIIKIVVRLAQIVIFLNNNNSIKYSFISTEPLKDAIFKRFYETLWTRMHCSKTLDLLPRREREKL